MLKQVLKKMVYMVISLFAWLLIYQIRLNEVNEGYLDCRLRLRQPLYNNNDINNNNIFYFVKQVYIYNTKYST